MLMLVVSDEDKDDAVRVILRTAKTGDGHYGDGRIFVAPVNESWTISSGKSGL